MNHPYFCPFQLNVTTCDDVITLNETMQIVTIKAILLFKPAQTCLTGSIVLQCGLTADKVEMVIILV